MLGRPGIADDHESSQRAGQASQSQPFSHRRLSRAAARGVMLCDSSICMALRMMGVVRHRSCRSISGGPRLNHRTAGKIVVKGIIAVDRCAVGHIEYRRLWNQL
jgi:hypothetical protein